MPMAALTSKLGSALEALLPSTIMAQQPTSTLFFLVLAAVTLGACLGHGLLLRRSSKKDAAAVDGGSKTPRRPLPLRKGYPVIGSTLEVLANLPRFLDWILDSVRDPALGGPDGLGAWRSFDGFLRI